jgi:hypothetical protein
MAEDIAELKHRAALHGEGREFGGEVGRAQKRLQDSTLRRIEIGVFRQPARTKASALADEPGSRQRHSDRDHDQGARRAHRRHRSPGS